MKTHEIKKEPITPGYFDKEVFVKTGETRDKWYIHYYIDGVEILKDFYSYDGIIPANNYEILKDFKTPEKIQASEINVDSVIAKIKENYILNPIGK